MDTPIKPQMEELEEADDAGLTPLTDEDDHELFEKLYDELKIIANSHMNREHNPGTLQPTALVNEAYLKLMGDNKKVLWENKKHFLCVAASVMRRVLIDSARSKSRQKRGGNVVRVELNEEEQLVENSPMDDVVSVHDALKKFETVSPEKAQLITLRFFGGLTIDEAAEIMSISRTTAINYWNFGRAWLHRELSR